MPALDAQVLDYLSRTLGCPARTRNWEKASSLPVFLSTRYDFSILELMGRDLLLVMDDEPEPETPATIRKHTDQIRTKWRGSVVYVRDQVASYNRKRLINHRVQFIVPGNQMYLPELGFNLKEHFRAPPPSNRQLSPASQAVLIQVLLHVDGADPTAAKLAPQLGYSAMTLSRAFDELEAFDIASTTMLGRERRLQLSGTAMATWMLAQPRLINPVKSRQFIRGRIDGLRAGFDALARYTDLAEPRLPVVAIAHKHWLSHRSSETFDLLPDKDDADFEVEVWRYEPRASHLPGVVDPLSLSLSIDRRDDDRVAFALDALMGQIQW